MYTVFNYFSKVTSFQLWSVSRGIVGFFKPFADVRVGGKQNIHVHMSYIISQWWCWTRNYDWMGWKEKRYDWMNETKIIFPCIIIWASIRKYVNSVHTTHVVPEMTKSASSWWLSQRTSQAQPFRRQHETNLQNYSTSSDHYTHCSWMPWAASRCWFCIYIPQGTRQLDYAEEATWPVWYSLPHTQPTAHLHCHNSLLEHLVVLVGHETPLEVLLAHSVGAHHCSLHPDVTFAAESISITNVMLCYGVLRQVSEYLVQRRCQH